jgi:hypothetical protein
MLSKPLSLFCFCVAVVFRFDAPAGEPISSTGSPQERARKAFVEAEQKLKEHPEDAELGWQFARTAFDWAEFAKDDDEREAIAN